MAGRYPKGARTMTPREIKVARLALGMNQREFAEALRVGSEAVIRSWESGRRPISGPATVAIELLLKFTTP
jgi:DNA-binding transcriptional regulator YiaG